MCCGSKLNKHSRVPSNSLLPKSLEGDFLGVLFGFYGWGEETSLDGGGMGKDRICGCGGFYGFCCCCN